jgi:hypothetical protein
LSFASASFRSTALRCSTVKASDARLECANGESKLGLEGIVSRRKD